MSRLRLAILVLGPVPIVALSLALTLWARSEGTFAPAQNSVLGRHLISGVAAGAEVNRRPDQPQTAQVAKALEATCHDSAKKLRPQLGPECHLVVRSPFVVAGNLSERQLDDWHRQTIRPAAEALANCYFKAAPTQPITVLLFDGEQSYNHYAKELFGEEGVSIYGYYKPNQRTLVMNIGTGGGTLVHELTHALVDFDFPKIPPWFNEGLASLHEQCNFRRDDSGPWIEGRVNWRLPGLQEAIRKKRLRSLESLIQDNDFRGRLEGTNYAQARYFCLYMQEQGVLRDYFKTFRDNQKQDPLGVKAVAEVFPDKSWKELDKEFRAWVGTLEQERE